MMVIYRQNQNRLKLKLHCWNVKCFICNAEKKINKFQLANQAIFLEQNILRETLITGSNSCSIWRFNYINFSKNGTFKILKNNFKKKNINRIEESIVLCYTSLARISGHVAKKNFPILN